MAFEADRPAGVRVGAAISEGCGLVGIRRKTNGDDNPIILAKELSGTPA